MGYDKRFSKIKNEVGQSTVEYILLLAVVTSLFFSVFRSDTFQQFFGEDSAFFQTVAERVSMSYRYATKVDIGNNVPSVPPDDHPSFAQPDGSTSRFFGFTDQSNYPDN